MPPTSASASVQVVIAIDPHKASRTAVAVDARLLPAASIRVPVNRDGYRQLRRFLRRTRAGPSKAPRVPAPR